jgi:CBS domain-containing protein
VGYANIAALLHGQLATHEIIRLMIVKAVIWSVALGSGTSGGVLAPVFMIGAALGAVLSFVLPHVAPGFWALMCLAAVVGGVMRSPLTGVIFALELTHQWDVLVPLVISSTAAYLLSALVLKRSVLTEKVARKGTHLTREYSVDPLEIFLVGEVMPRNFVSFREDTTLHSAARRVVGAWSDGGKRSLEHGQRLYPVLDADGHLVGAITRHRLLSAALKFRRKQDARIDEVMVRKVVVGYPDMTLRELTNLMAQTELSNVPIVARDDQKQVLSVMTVEHLLRARLIDINEERQTERVINFPLIRAVRGGMMLMRRRRAEPPPVEEA